jgi:hypothetical protein
LTEIAVRAGKLGRARDLIDQLETAAGENTPEVGQLSRMLECVESGGANPERWMELAADNPSAVMAAGIALAVGGAQPLCAEQAFRATRLLGGGWAWGSLLALQSLWLAEGRVQETVELLEDELDQGAGGVFNLFMFDSGISDAFDGGAQRAEEIARNTYGDRYRGAGGVNLWLLGVWHASHGDAERTEALAEELERYVSTERGREARMLADALRGHAALARGEAGEAIRRFQELKPTAPLWRYFWEFHEALAPERIRLARELLKEGSYEEAIRVASVFDHPSPITYLAYLAPSLSIRLRAAEALGRTDLSARLRERLRHLGWADGAVPLSMSGPLLTSHTGKETS